MIGAIVQGAGSLIGGAMNMLAAKQNYEYSRKLADQQFQHQKMLQDEQNDWNLDQWNRENEYNSYLQQVQRMKDAGLNVGMMMGSNNMTNAPALESASPSVPSSPVADFAKAPDIEGTINNIANLSVQKKQQELQERLLDKQLKRTDRELDIRDKSVTSQAELNEILGRKAESDIGLNKAREDQTRALIQQTNKSLEVMDEQMNLYHAQANEMNALAEKAREEKNLLKYNAITQRMNANSQRLVANATKEYYKSLGAQADSVVKLNEQNVKNLVSALAKTDQETRLLKQQFEYNGESFKVDLQIKKGQFKLIGLQADSQEIQNKLANATFYADVADAYIGSVDKAANAVSDCAGAFIDVSTAGATTVLKGRGAVDNQKAQTGMYTKLGQQGMYTPVAGFSLGK